MDEQFKRRIQKEGVIRGVVLGLVIAASSVVSFYYLTQWVTSTPLIVGGYFVFFPIVVPLGFAILFILSLRKKIGGYWVFRNAVMGIFIMFFAAFLVQYLLKDIVFARIVEPQMVQKTENALIADAKADFKRRNISQKDIDQKVNEIKQSLDPQKTSTVGQQIQGIGISVIFLFVLSLIFAAFFKLDPYVPGAGSYADAGKK